MMCSKCGQVIGKDLDYCKNCGQKLNQEENPSGKNSPVRFFTRKRIFYMLGLIFILFLGYFILPVMEMDQPGTESKEECMGGGEEEDLVSFRIASESRNAQILIDGSPYGKTIEDLEDGILEGMDRESTIQLVKETPWGEFRSQEVTIGEVGNYLELDLYISSQDLDQDIMESINSFLQDDLLARRDLDPGRYGNLLDPELEERQEEILAMKEEGLRKEREIEGIYFDLDSLLVREEAGEYHGSARMRYDFLEKKILSDKESETIKGGESLIFSLVYQGGQWMVYGLEEIPSLEGGNIKEYEP